MSHEQAASQRTPIKSASVEATVIRCGCTPEQKAAPDWHARHNKVCPRPRYVEDRGVVAYYHRNPFKRVWFRLTHPRAWRGAIKGV